MSDASLSTDQITRALSRLFARYRVVVWSDPEGQFGEEFKTATLDGVTGLVVANNEFGLKHRVLREERDAKFLLYRSGEPPEQRDNWLLDVELAYGTFVGDRETLLAQDVGLPEGTEQLASEHPKFFTTAKRRNALSKQLGESDSADQVRAKMLAVIAGADDSSLGSVLRALLQTTAESDDEAIDLINECGLDGFLWQGTCEQFGYEPQAPTIEDFALWLFDQSLNRITTDIDSAAGERKAANAAVFFDSWQDSVKHSPAFRALSKTAAQTLDVRQWISGRDFRELLALDAFAVFDERILTGLTAQVLAGTVSAREVAGWVRDRRRTFWVNDPTDDQHILEHLYQAVGAATQFLRLVDEFTPMIESLDDGLSKYTGSWFQVDQAYRQFTLHAREADNHPILEQLRDKVEKFYSNKFLRPLGDAWQPHVAAAKPWRAAAVRSQTKFFDTHVAPVLKGGRNKVVVIISDGMRYEVADELRGLIRQQDRYEAELDHLLGVLPSYTQLGMAALLPNSTLEPDGTSDQGFVKVDGKPSNGTENRAKILQTAEGTAIECETFLAMDKGETRELLKSSRVLYVYHNRIDDTGDKRLTESKTFEATQETFDEMLSLLKKLTGANANNILITADHGFLYQDTKLDDSEYVSEKPQGDEIHTHSRFVLGHGLEGGSAFTKFTASDLNLAGDVEVLIAKSIGRLKQRGSGTRYVHGGAALQEIVIPVVSVSKKRASDVGPVDVELVVRSSNITTGQLAVEMYQATPVTDKTQPRALRIGLFASNNEPISTQVTHTFDLQAEDPRDRTVTEHLLLTKAADEHDGESVELRLDSPVPKSERVTNYRRASFTLRRSFKSDFDF